MDEEPEVSANIATSNHDLRAGADEIIAAMRNNCRLGACEISDLMAAAKEIVAVVRNNYRCERRLGAAVVGDFEIAGIIAKHLGRGSSWSIY